MITDAKNAIALYPVQLMSETVKLTRQSANQPIEIGLPDAKLREVMELGGDANASGNIVKRERPLGSFIFPKCRYLVG